MSPRPASLHRLRFLARVAGREAEYLAGTDGRLFERPFTAERVAALPEDFDLAERVDAFVSRFGRLQDTLGDKLLPALLSALGEKTGAAIDNLDLAERFGFVPSSDQWMEMRRLRNQMVHEYIEDPLVMAKAMQAAHGFVPVLTRVAGRLISEIERRGWLK